MAFSLVEAGRRADVSQINKKLYWKEKAFREKKNNKQPATFPKPTQMQKLKLNIQHLGFTSGVVFHLCSHTHSLYFHLPSPSIPRQEAANFHLFKRLSLSQDTVSGKGTVPELSPSANANASMNLRLETHLYFYPLSHH